MHFGGWPEQALALVSEVQNLAAQVRNRCGGGGGNSNSNGGGNGSLTPRGARQLLLAFGDISKYEVGVLV